MAVINYTIGYNVITDNVFVLSKDKVVWFKTKVLIVRD